MLKSLKNKFGSSKTNEDDLHVQLNNIIISDHMTDCDGKYRMLYWENLKNNKADGYGTSYLNGKLWYDGQWKDGKWHGKGIEFTPGGTKCYVGQWKHGKRHGIGIEFLNGKILRHGVYCHGIFSGQQIPKSPEKQHQKSKYKPPPKTKNKKSSSESSSESKSKSSESTSESSSDSIIKPSFEPISDDLPKYKDIS